MKITLHTKNHQPKPKTNLRAEIISRLNGFAGSNFFKSIGEKIICPICANPNVHNKLIIVLAIFADSYYDRCENSSFAAFGYANGMEFNIPLELDEKLFNLLENITSTKDIQISID